MQEPNYLSQAPRRLASVHLVRARLTSSIFSITRQAHGIKHLLQSLMRDSLSSTVRLKLSRQLLHDEIKDVDDKSSKLGGYVSF